MSITLDETVDIAAPAELVWEVIVDFPRYAEWNPFVIECRSSLKPGDPIDLLVKLMSRPQWQREFILEHEPGRIVRYGIRPMPLGAMVSSRSNEVSTVDVAHSQYHMHFELTGWLAPLVRLLLGRRMLKGFHGMTAGIKTRAEALQRQRQGARA
jgi:uncharacterized protein YndB with AHSA1/START domain